MTLALLVRSVARFFTPLEVFSPKVMRLWSFSLVGTFLLCWAFIKLPFIPMLGEMLSAFGVLWRERGLFDELMTSAGMNLLALSASTVVAFSLGYLWTIPAVKPILKGLTKLRFLGFTGLVFVFSIYVGTGMRQRFALLMFALVWFYLTTMLSIMASVKDEKFEHAATLRLGRWRTVYEVLIRGTLAEGLETLRQYGAYGWAMVTAVEGLTRSGGGVGVMILNDDKYLQLAPIFAIVSTIMMYGIGQDYILGLVRRLLCKYAYINVKGA